MPEVPLAEHGFGLFGPAFGVPEGGFCLSTFLLVEREGRILAGRMGKTHAERWTEQWAPNLAFYEGERREGLFAGWRFPATYLRTGEDPRDAAQRVWADQLGLDGHAKLPEPTVVSEAGSSRRRPTAQHWDVLFLFRTEGPPLDAVPEHWAELDYRTPEALLDEELVMLHGELVELL